MGCEGPFGSRPSRWARTGETIHSLPAYPVLGVTYVNGQAVRQLASEYNIYPIVGAVKWYRRTRIRNIEVAKRKDAKEAKVAEIIGVHRRGAETLRFYVEIDPPVFHTRHDM